VAATATATATTPATAAAAAIIDKSATAKAMMASFTLLHGCGSGTSMHMSCRSRRFTLLFPLISLCLMDVWRMHEARSTASGRPRTGVLALGVCFAFLLDPSKCLFFPDSTFSVFFFQCKWARALSSLYKA
jgi:hypothetical protein